MKWIGERGPSLLAQWSVTCHHLKLHISCIPCFTLPQNCIFYSTVCWVQNKTPHYFLNTGQTPIPGCWEDSLQKDLGSANTYRRNHWWINEWASQFSSGKGWPLSQNVEWLIPWQCFKTYPWLYHTTEQVCWLHNPLNPIGIRTHPTWLNLFCRETFSECQTFNLPMNFC